MTTSSLQLHVRQLLATESSYFRQALLREDVLRLERLDAIASQSSSLEAFLKEAVYTGWSTNDMRTHELRPALDPFLERYFAASTGESDGADLIRYWQALDQLRMDRLVGCLSRVPRVEVD